MPGTHSKKWPAEKSPPTFLDLLDVILVIVNSEVSPEDHPVFLQADDLLAVRFRFLFISDAGKGVGKAIAFSGKVVDEYVPAATITSVQDVTAIDHLQDIIIQSLFVPINHSSRSSALITSGLSASTRLITSLTCHSRAVSYTNVFLQGFSFLYESRHSQHIL